MPRVLGVTEILNKRYKIMENVPEWITQCLGVLPDPFHIQIIGRPKNGKTTFAMKLVYGLAESNQIFYNSKEEGDCKTIQDAYILVNMIDRVGQVFLGDGYWIDEMIEYLKGPGKRKKIVVIDSLDYLKLTKRDYIKLIEAFPKKSFIILCWGGKKGTEWVCDDYYGNQIKHMMGSIVGVHDFVAESRGRYGPTEPYLIWDKGQLKKKTHQKTLFD